MSRFRSGTYKMGRNCCQCGESSGLQLHPKCNKLFCCAHYAKHTDCRGEIDSIQEEIEAVAPKQVRFSVSEAKPAAPPANISDSMISKDISDDCIDQPASKPHESEPLAEPCTPKPANDEPSLVTDEAKSKSFIVCSLSASGSLSLDGNDEQDLAEEAAEDDGSDEEDKDSYDDEESLDDEELEEAEEEGNDNLDSEEEEKSHEAAVTSITKPEAALSPASAEESALDVSSTPLKDDASVEESEKMIIADEPIADSADKKLIDTTAATAESSPTATEAAITPPTTNPTTDDVEKTPCKTPTLHKLGDQITCTELDTYNFLNMLPKGKFSRVYHRVYHEDSGTLLRPGTMRLKSGSVFLCCARRRDINEPLSRNDDDDDDHSCDSCEESCSSPPASLLFAYVSLSDVETLLSLPAVEQSKFELRFRMHPTLDIAVGEMTNYWDDSFDESGGPLQLVFQAINRMVEAIFATMAAKAAATVTPIHQIDADDATTDESKKKLDDDKVAAGGVAKKHKGKKNGDKKKPQVVSAPPAAQSTRTTRSSNKVPDEENEDDDVEDLDESNYRRGAAKPKAVKQQRQPAKKLNPPPAKAPAASKASASTCTAGDGDGIGGLNAAAVVNLLGMVATKLAEVGGAEVGKKKKKTRRYEEEEESDEDDKDDDENDRKRRSKKQSVSLPSTVPAPVDEALVVKKDDSTIFEEQLEDMIKKKALVAKAQMADLDDRIALVKAHDKLEEAEYQSRMNAKKRSREERSYEQDTNMQIETAKTKHDLAIADTEFEAYRKKKAMGQSFV